MIDFSLNDVASQLFGAGPATPEDITTATTRPNVGPTIEAGRGLAPQNPLNQNAGAGRGFINPKYALSTAAAAPSEPAEAAPAVPSTYNAQIAQAESGNNPNIGYHNREKSTAYGPYGITAGAWQDARRVDPSLPADITQATPEQMTRAQNDVTANNTKYLQNYGVEVNPNTLSAAHFLGAKGLADYLRDGTISPAAAAANGGEANVRRIVQQRLGGTMAPASGGVPAAPAPAEAPVSPEQAAQAPAAEAYTGAGLKTPAGQTIGQLQQQNQYGSILNSNSQEGIAKLAFDPMTPPDVQRAALDKLHGTMAIQQGMEKAQRTIDSLGSNPTPQALNKAMNDKDTGSYFKVLLFQALGWTGKAKQELNKIMPDVTYTGVTLPDGQNYNVKYNKDTGETMAAWDSQGQMITDPAKLGEIAAGGVNPQTAKAHLMPQTSGSPVTKTINGQLVNGIQVYDPLRKSFYVQYGTQRDMNPQGWTSATQNVEQQAVLGKQKAQIDLWKKFQNADTQAKFNYIEDTNKALVAQYGPNAPIITPAEMGLQAPALPGGAVAPQAPAAGGAVAPQAPAAAAPAPSAAAPGAAPAQPAAPGGRPTLEALQQEAAKKKQALEVGTDEMKKFNKYSEEEITPKADAGGRVSAIRKQQIKGPDGILANPELAGLMQGQGGTFDEVRNIVRDLVTGNYKDPNDLSRRVASLDLTQRQKDVLYTQIGLNASLAPETLRANAGPGAISEAEHKLNNQANVDITRQPLYSGLTLMTRSQFVNDLAVARNEFKAAHPELNTTDKFNSAWNAEKGRLEKEYEAIYGERAKYIAKYSKAPGAVVDAFKHYPVPEFDTEKRQWVYGGYSDKAKRPSLDSFVR